MTDGNMLLKDEELDKLEALRMSRSFTEFARLKFAHLDRDQFNTSSISAGKNSEFSSKRILKTPDHAFLIGGRRGMRSNPSLHSLSDGL